LKVVAIEQVVSVRVLRPGREEDDFGPTVIVIVARIKEFLESSYSANTAIWGYEEPLKYPRINRVVGPASPPTVACV
jgi:hypothetical protein